MPSSTLTTRVRGLLTRDQACSRWADKGNRVCQGEGAGREPTPHHRDPDRSGEPDYRVPGTPCGWQRRGLIGSNRRGLQGGAGNAPYPPQQMPMPPANAQNESSPGRRALPLLNPTTKALKLKQTNVMNHRASPSQGPRAGCKQTLF